MVTQENKYQEAPGTIKGSDGLLLHVKDEGKAYVTLSTSRAGMKLSQITVSKLPLLLNLGVKFRAKEVKQDRVNRGDQRKRFRLSNQNRRANGQVPHDSKRTLRLVG